MKTLSLQEQLLKAGLTSKNKAHKVKHDKRKQTIKQQKNKVEVLDEASLLANKAKAEQLEKDKLLNAELNKEAEKKQITGQINQLINLHKLAKNDDGVAFNFTDNNKIRSIYVSEALRESLVKGTAVIVKFVKTYEVVPAPIAGKIELRDKSRVMYLADKASGNDDEYAGFEVPDDLMW
tara:strand:- start:1162 stop:1698 length:537 start_codon:yes stop_codon:yes gene_type:complete